ncbi:MAG: flagellar biosynthesis anti-sigma factor FlgM [Desulfovibrionaceae bacterium]
MDQKKQQDSVTVLGKPLVASLEVVEERRPPPHMLSPEDRAEKVRALKRKVQSGEYKPDALEVAYILTRFLDPVE